MIARLWWKEMRVVWPAWAVLFWVAVAVEVMIVTLDGPGGRQGDTVVVAVGWALIYALVAGAAAFAGERENETLGLLDALAVRRPTLWAGKVSFVLATSVALAAVMLVVGLLGVDWGTLRQPNDFTKVIAGESPFTSVDVIRAVLNRTFKALPVFGTVLFMAAAWGLFWSAAIRNPMIAGVLALGTVGGVLWLGSGGDQPAFFANPIAYPLFWGTALLALGGSAWLMIRPPQAAWARNWGARAEDAEDVGPAPAHAIVVWRASADRSLRWKAFRQGRLWAALSLAWAWGGLLLLSLIGHRGGADANSMFGFFLCVELGLVLIAGVGIFGDETVRGTQRFLLHQGVRPGRIWLRSVGVWIMVFAVIAAGTVLLPAALPLLNGLWSGRLGRAVADLFQLPPPVLRGLAGAVAATLTVFAVGLLAGMVFRRRITAVLVAVLAFLGIVAFPLTLVLTDYLPAQGMLLIPLSLALISWAWSGDWLDERPGAGRWLRLAGLAAVPLATLPPAYVAYRAWGVADVGPVAQAPAPPPPPEPGKDTEREFHRLLGEVSEAVQDLAVQPDRWMDTPGYSKKTPAELIARIHRAAAELPPIWPAQARPGGTSFTTDPDIGKPQAVASILDDHAGVLIERGDLDGAWADIRAIRQIARKEVEGMPTTMASQFATYTERLGILRGLRWAAHPAQAEARLRAALRELDVVGLLPTPDDILRAEAPILDRTLDLPVEELERGILGTGYRETMRRVFDSLVVFPWWERERARRVIRADLAFLLGANGPMELRKRAQPVLWRARQGESNMIVNALMPSLWLVDESDRALAGGSALVQVIALRAWSLAHGGAYPSTLQTLVADGILAELPVDPYSGRPFTWVPTGGRSILPVTLRSPRATDKPGAIPAGRWQLIAVGPDGVYSGDGNQGFGSWAGPANDDLIFPLP